MDETTLRSCLAYAPVELGFGTSGLRGKIEDMTDLECYINTVGFLRFMMSNGNIQQGATVSLGGDLRDSTPRIMRAALQAITDEGFGVENCGLLPTPAIAFWALQKGQPCVMVTGSHIPADRNGIKFYKVGGEVLKSDETPIKVAVAEARAEIYHQDFGMSAFDEAGALKTPPVLPAELNEPVALYKKRYTDCFNGGMLAGKQIIFYQHSAVGRDLFVELLKDFGAEVVAVDRSEIFIPIDTENITPDNARYFKKLAADYPGAFAIISTDGDSDRPFVIDENGIFYRGDILGLVVADYLQADFMAAPISANDAIDTFVAGTPVELVHTKIGSPYVVLAMQSAVGKKVVTGWEVNGGFLLGNDIPLGNGTLQALPTRDAALPILIALKSAIDKSCAVSEVFAALPKRYTGAGLLDNFPVDQSAKLMEIAVPEDSAKIAEVFNSSNGFGVVTSIDKTDGIRMTFDNGDIAHIRPSGNAPQLRIYTVASSQERADAIVALGVQEPNGLLRKLSAQF